MPKKKSKSHTPGPWALSRHFPQYIMRKNRRGGYIAHCAPGHKESGANRNLILAAPDMLKALEAGRFVLEWYNKAQFFAGKSVHPAAKGTLDAINAAIAKAKGQS